MKHYKNTKYNAIELRNITTYYEILHRKIMKHYEKLQL